MTGVEEKKEVEIKSGDGKHLPVHSNSYQESGSKN